MNKIGLFIVGLVAMAFVLSSCQSDQQAREAQGVFEATEVMVAAQTDGAVLRVLVDEGDAVEVGQELALIDTTFLHFQHELLTTQGGTVNAAGFTNVNQQLAALQSQVQTLTRERERFQRLVNERVASASQLRTIEAQLAQARAQLSAARAALSQKNRSSEGSIDALAIQRAQIEEMLQRSHVMAPIEGVVLARYLNQGELAGQGRPIMKLADLSEFYLRTYVTAEQLADLSLGSAVVVSSDMGEEHPVTYEGTVVWISQRAEFTPKNIQSADQRSSLVYAVKVKVPNDGSLRIGQYGKMTW